MVAHGCVGVPSDGIVVCGAEHKIETAALVALAANVLGATGGSTFEDALLALALHLDGRANLDEDQWSQLSSRLTKCLASGTGPDGQAMSDRALEAAEALFDLARSRPEETFAYVGARAVSVEVAPSEAARTFLQASGLELVKGTAIGDGLAWSLLVPEPRSLPGRGPDSVALTAWPSASVLADLLLSAPEVVHGRSVLELGCGCTGIVALAAAAAGASEVLTTDVSVPAVEFTEANVVRNSTALATPLIRTAVFDWADPEGLPVDATFSLVLGADIVHDYWMPPLLVDVLERVLAENGVALIVNGAERHRYGVVELGSLLRESKVLTAEVRRIPSELLERLGSACDLHEPGMEYDLYTIRRSRAEAA